MMGVVPGLFGWIFVVGREYRSPENCSDTREFVTTNALMNSLGRKKKHGVGNSPSSIHDLLVFERV
jgi:hypothetical protein